MATGYYLEKRCDKNGDAPIRVSISVQGARIITSIGYNINPSKWDEKRQRAKQGSSNSKGVTYSTINARISEITAFFIRYENEATQQDIALTKEDITKVWAINFKKGDKVEATTQTAQTLLELFDLFIKEQGKANSWTFATVKRFKYMRKQVADFKPNATFESFNRAGLVAYVAYLQDVKQLRNSTITKNLAFLRWFLRWAVENNHSTNVDFERFRPKLKNIKSADKRIIFLTWDELMTVYNYPIPAKKEYLQRVRDVFCFCCFTSLRYSDVQNLKRSDIVGDMLHITTVKTSDNLQIELNKYSKTILQRYEVTPYEGGKALPVISNQRMNDYLKELGEMCGIDEPQTVVYFKGSERIEEVYPKYELLGTHAGRRTFICNALALGIPANVVMKWTGHSDYKAMKPYIDVADDIKAKEMNKFNEM